MKLFKLLPVLIFATGCAAKLPESAFHMDESVMKTRQHELKDMGMDYDTTINDSIAALQDMGFLIESSDDNIGYVHATKTRELTSGFSAALIEIGTNMLSSAAGSHQRYRHPQKVKVNAYLLMDPNDGQCKMRTTFFNTTYDRHTVPLSYLPVEQGEVYQSFYNKIGKSSFMEENLND